MDGGKKRQHTHTVMSPGGVLSVLLYGDSTMGEGDWSESDVLERGGVADSRAAARVSEMEPLEMDLSISLHDTRSELLRCSL